MPRWYPKVVLQGKLIKHALTEAAALQAAAPPGGFLCSAATARLVRGLVRLEAVAPEAQPKLPTAAYQIRGHRSHRVAMGRRGARPVSPFVGRARELATLQALLGQAEAGRGQVVGIVGSPAWPGPACSRSFATACGRGGSRIWQLAACLTAKPPPMSPSASSYGTIAASPQPTRRRASAPRCTGGSRRWV